MCAKQTLVNASVTDFLIVEYRAEIGGRVAHTTFGSQPDGTPYVIELGANWVGNPFRDGRGRKTSGRRAAEGNMLIRIASRTGPRLGHTAGAGKSHLDARR